MDTAKKITQYALKRGLKIAIGHPAEWTQTKNLITGEKKKRLFAYSTFSEFYLLWTEPVIYFYSLAELREHLDGILNQ